MDQEELTPVGIKTSKQQQQKNCEHLTSVFAHTEVIKMEGWC